MKPLIIAAIFIFGVNVTAAEPGSQKPALPKPKDIYNPNVIKPAEGSLSVGLFDDTTPPDVKNKGEKSKSEGEN